MATEVRLRRGTALEHETFTGVSGEVTVDTTNTRLRVHDGVTPGGHVIAKQEDVTSSQLLTDPVTGLIYKMAVEDGVFMLIEQ